MHTIVRVIYGMTISIQHTDFYENQVRTVRGSNLLIRLETNLARITEGCSSIGRNDFARFVIGNRLDFPFRIRNLPPSNKLRPMLMIDDVSSNRGPIKLQLDL